MAETLSMAQPGNLTFAHVYKAHELSPLRSPVQLAFIHSFLQSPRYNQRGSFPPLASWTVAARIPPTQESRKAIVYRLNLPLAPLPVLVTFEVLYRPHASLYTHYVPSSDPPPPQLAPSHHDMDDMHCACTYTETRFACGHSSGARVHRQCRKNLHQLMRIYDPWEFGLPFQWGGSCKPDRRRNVRVKHSGQICGGCRNETRRGWMFRGVRSGHWT